MIQDFMTPAERLEAFAPATEPDYCTNCAANWGWFVSSIAFVSGFVLGMLMLALIERCDINDPPSPGLRHAGSEYAIAGMY